MGAKPVPMHWYDGLGGPMPAYTTWNTVEGLRALVDGASWREQYVANYTASCKFGRLYTIEEAEALLAATADVPDVVPCLAAGPDVYPVPGAPSVITSDGRTRPTPARLAYFEQAYQSVPALRSLILSGAPLFSPQSAMPPIYIREPPRTEEDTLFLRREYRDLALMGALVPCNRAWVARHGNPRLVTPCFVVTDAKSRQINDYQLGNLLAPPSHVAYEALADFFIGAHLGDLFAKLDVRSAYYHLPVTEAMAPYLCLVFDGQIWQQTTAPFGGGSVPELLESFMKVTRRDVRAMALYTIHELDDSGLNAGPDPVAAARKFWALLACFAAHGWLIPWDKVQFPAAAMDLLGAHMDSFPLVVSPTARRVARLFQLLDMLAGAQSAPLLLIARLAGTLVSMQGLIQYALPLSQPFLDCLRAAVPLTGWHVHVLLPPRVFEAIAFLRAHWARLTPVPMTPPVHATHVMHGDATEYSVAVALYLGHQPVVDLTRPLAYARCDTEKFRIERNELYAHVWGLVQLDVRAVILLPVLDSQVAYAYVAAGGGPVASLAELAWQRTRLLIERMIAQRKPVWIPSHQNVLSDALTRVPLPLESYLPKPASYGAFGPCLRWLNQHLPLPFWRLWPCGAISEPPLGWPIALAEPFDLIASQELAFVVAPPASWARRVLRWVVQRAVRAAVLLPFWRDACWWPLTEAAGARFTILSQAVLSACPFGVYLYGFA